MTPDPMISVEQAKRHALQLRAYAIAAGEDCWLDRDNTISADVVLKRAADIIESLRSALVQAEQARDEARKQRDKHLQAIGPAYQAGFRAGENASNQPRAHKQCETLSDGSRRHYSRGYAACQCGDMPAVRTAYDEIDDLKKQLDALASALQRAEQARDEARQELNRVVRQET